MSTESGAEDVNLASPYDTSGGEEYLFNDSFEDSDYVPLRLVHRDLLDLVEQQLLENAHDNTRAEEPRRPAILDTWLYNWQSKKMEIPSAMIAAGKSITEIDKSFVSLNDFFGIIKEVPDELKPDDLMLLQTSILKGINNYEKIKRRLEAKVNAVRLYWFPETVRQLELGAYKSVRYPPIEWKVSPLAESMACSICSEPFTVPATLSPLNLASLAAVGAIVTPVVLTRRCTMNPFLNHVCDLSTCQCAYPSFCLTCVLQHLLKNCIHEGKSAVACPNCRGEFCIYDIQEVTLVADPVEAYQREVERLQKLLQQTF